MNEEEQKKELETALLLHKKYCKTLPDPALFPGADPAALSMPVSLNPEVVAAFNTRPRRERKNWPGKSRPKTPLLEDLALRRELNKVYATAMRQNRSAARRMFSSHQHWDVEEEHANDEPTPETSGSYAAERRKAGPGASPNPSPPLSRLQQPLPPRRLDQQTPSLDCVPPLPMPLHSSSWLPCPPCSPADHPQQDQKRRQ